MTKNDWCVAVFKCTQGNLRNALLDFYSFMKDLEGVKSLHFLIRDRIENEIVVSFRVLATEKAREIVQSKMNYKLAILVPNKFAVNPDSQNDLNKYVAWGNGERISESGIDKFPEDPDSALAMLKSEPSYFYDEEHKYMAVTPEEARELFEKEGIKVIEIYAVCGMLHLLSIPDKVLKSRKWDEKLFKQTTEMLLTLSKEPSTKGFSRHLVLYGQRI